MAPPSFTRWHHPPCSRDGATVVLVYVADDATSAYALATALCRQLRCNSSRIS